MTSIIQSVIAEPLSLKDLEIMLNHEAKNTSIIQYDDLAQFESLKQMFQDVDAYIILLQIESPDAPPVGHFIAMLNHPDHYEHFDPYGIGADEELSITHEKPYLTGLLRGSDKRIDDNQRRFQHMKEDVNTCGRWCVGRVHLKKYELKRFGKIIDTSSADPDTTVTLLTMLLPTETKLKVAV
jgi:hypothetical protein